MTMREDCKLPDWPAQEDRSQTSIRQFELHFNALPAMRPNRVAAPRCQHQTAFASANKRKSLSFALLLLGLLALTQGVHASLFEAWRRTTPGDGDSSLPKKSAPVVCAAPDGSVYQVIAMPERGNIIEGLETGLIVERLDAQGALLWKEVFRDTRSLNSPRSFYLFTAACDLNGNLLISARMGETHILLKYAPSGLLLWNSRVPHDFPQWAAPFALVPGPYGMVFLCYNNSLVFGFDSSGFNVLERNLKPAQYDSAIWNTARMISTTNLVVAGTVRTNAGPPFLATATISIPSGAFKFVLGAETDSIQVAMDGKQNLYTVDFDRTLRCISPTGSNLWQRAIQASDDWNGPLTLLPDDRNGCVFVFVSSTDSTPRRAYLYRFSMSGQFEWRQAVGHPAATAYSEGKCILDGQGGVFIVGERRVSSSNDSATPPAMDAFFLQWIMSRQTDFGSYPEVLEDRIFWEGSRRDDPSPIPTLAFNATALPGGGIALVSRVTADGPVTLNCLRPALERDPIWLPPDWLGNSPTWSVGMIEPQASGLDGPFQSVTSSSHVGGYWDQEGGFFTYRGGYYRHSRNSRILAAFPVPDNRRLGFVPSVDPGEELLPPERASLRTATNYLSVLRWTAPRDGRFVVSGLFHSLSQPYYNGSDRPLTPVGIRHGTNQLVNFVPDGSSQFPFNVEITVRQGDTVDFRAQPVAVAGETFQPGYIGVQAEISVPNHPPTISVRTGGGLVWSNGAAYLQLTAAVSDPEGQPVEVQIFLGDQLISILNAPPYTRLVALPQGRQTLTVRAFDASGLLSVSTPITVHVPEGPDDTLVIPESVFQSALFRAAYWEKAQDRSDTAVPLSIALVTVVEALEQYPDLPVEAIEAFFDWAVGATNATTTQARLVSSQPTHAFSGSEFMLQAGLFVDRVFTDPALKEIEKIKGGSFLTSFLRAGMRSSDLLKGFDCASPYASGCTPEDRLLAFQDRFDLAMNDLRVFQVDLANRSVNATTRRIKDHLDIALNDQTDALLGGMRSISGELKAEIGSLRDAFGNVVTSQNQLMSFVQGEFKHVRDDIANLQESNKLLLDGQGQIISLLMDEQERAADERRRRAEAERRQADRQMNDAAVGVLANLIGFADPEAGQRVAVVGRNLLSIRNALEDLASGDLSAMGSAVMTGNIIGAVFSIINAFGDSGPTPEQIILEEIGQLKQMIHQLGEQMHDRFDRVDARLIQIYEEFSRRFDGLDFRLGLLQSDVQTIQNLTLDLRTTLARVELRMQLLFQAQEARRYNLLVGTLENYENQLVPMTPTAFADLVLQFRNAATLDAVDEIASPTAGRPLLDAASLAGQLAGTNDNLTANLNYLNAVILAHGWMGGPGLSPASNTRIPSASEWSFGADGVTRLYSRWPQLARSNPFYNQRLNDVVNSGETLRAALERITLLRSGNQWQTNALWGHLVQNYRNKAAQFLAALHNFELEQRVALVAQGDSSRTPYSPYVDFWGVVNQSTDYLPSAFSQSIPPRNSGNTAGGPSLSPPPGWTNLLESVSELTFGNLINAFPVSLRYQNADFVEDRRAYSIGIDYYWNGDPDFGSPDGTGQIREGRFRMEIVAFTQAPEVVEYRWQYIHPQFSEHRFRRSDGTFLRFGISVFNKSNVDQPNLWQGYSRYFNRRVSSQGRTYGWPNWNYIIGDLWTGQNGPSWERLVLSAARTNFAHIATYLPDSTSEAALHQVVESRLRTIQYAHLNSLNTVLSNPGTSLGAAALELSGARELLRVFVELGLPNSYQQSDVLRALFTGSERLPDLPLLVNFCEEARVRSLTDALHTGRPDFAGLLNNRIAALEAVLHERLTEIQATGQAEIIPLVSDTLRELYFTREATQNPLRPYLFVHSVAPNQAGVRVLGERYVTYGLEWSSNMVHWVTQPGTVTDGGSISLNFNAANSGFLRVKSQ